MAKLHEYRSKGILRAAGIAIPKGGMVETPGEARAMATGIGGPIVVKAQAWVTGRAGRNLIRFAETPDEAASAATQILGQKVGDFTIDRLLVEERLTIESEFYLGLLIDDHARAPVVILSSVGGSGIEEIAREHPDRVARLAVNVMTGLRDFEARDLCRRAGIAGELMMRMSAVMLDFYNAVRGCDARAAEINPLALTADGKLVALDARITVDDYAVFRHPELGIEIAREFDRPPTPLERAAWLVEKDDYRGTFYFVQMMTGFHKGERVVGFHGNGGGGAMINMDALLAGGFRIANFVDTSGNPPASKVYRAARLILSQNEIDGYFMGGSGVASQEQYHTARGLVKAFMDAPLTVPAVIRIGGNAEEQAITILQRANGAFPAPVEAFGRDDSPVQCVERLSALIRDHIGSSVPPRVPPQPVEPYQFETVTGGTVTLDHAACRTCESKACIDSCEPKILSLESGVPVLNISRDEAKRGGCIECLACEVECYFLGNRGGRVLLPVPGINGQGR